MNSSRATIAVLMGGPDAEREVSLNSGREVAAALREGGGLTIIERVIDRPTIFELQSLLREAAPRIDAVFPVLHGQWGEGGPLQELLEQVGLPYVGSMSQPAALAMDKLRTKALLAVDGVPTPASQELGPTDHCPIAPPLVLKPVDDGSSVDLRICRSNAEIERARRELHPRRRRLMAESYISGREITVGIVLGQALPLIEIIPSKAVEFYDYEAKYTRDDTSYVLDPELPPGVAEQCTQIALLAFDRIGCRDLARVDLMVDERGPWFLEINTMPGFTTHSLVPMAARRRGVEMPQLCASLVGAALDRSASLPLASLRPFASSRR